MPSEKRDKPKTKWRPAPGEMVRVFEDALRPVAGARTRKMFGYPCAFVNGQMFTGLFQESMTLRLAESDRARLLAMDGASPFEPMPGRAMKEYVVVPPSLLESPAELRVWIDKAFAFAGSLPPKQPKGKRAGGKAVKKGEGHAASRTDPTKSRRRS